MGNVDQQDFKAIPTDDELQKAYEVELVDSNGEKVPFGKLLEGESKTIVVMIRHFFCGSCQDYVAQLATVKQEALKEAGVNLVIIGCGGWEPIKMYAEMTGFKGPIYANPNVELYRIFKTTVNLGRTPAGEQRPSYLTLSLLPNVARSIWRAVKNPTVAGKGGSSSQNGGEFIFTSGKKCIFASRMRHTEDHVEVADLMKEAGVNSS